MGFDFNQAVDELVNLLRVNGQELGQEFISDAGTFRVEAAASLQRLQRAVGEPGFREAVTAERDSLALVGAGRAISRGDAVDNRLLGMLDGFLSIAVRLLGG